MNWQNRIVGQGVKPASQFTANPLNYRQHPASQRKALVGVLNEVGWVQNVLENIRTGNLIDGHERVWDALQNNDADVPYIQVDLSEEEEALVLATLDPLSALATTDKQKLDELLREVATNDANVQQMLSELAEKSGIIPSDWSSAMELLPNGDKPPFQQMTFTVSDKQAETIGDALSKAKGQGSSGDTGNENSNGNALAMICEDYLGKG